MNKAKLGNLGMRLGRSGLLRLFGSALLILAIGKAVQLSMHAVLARQLGAAGFGQISLAIATSNILALVLTFGIPSAGMRLVATFKGNNDWPRLAGFLRLACIIVLGAMVVSILGAGIYGYVSGKGGVRDLAWLIALILPITVLGASREGIMRGFHNIVQALGPREFVGPLIVVVGLIVASPTNPLLATFVFMFGYLLAESLGLYLLWRNLPKQILAADPIWEQHKWLAISLPMQLAASARVLLQRIDLIYVGALLGLEWAGIYAVAHRLAQALNLIGRISSFAVSPLMAKSYHVDNPKTLIRITKHATLIVLGMGLPAFALMTVFAPFLVSLFGVVDYSDSVRIMIVLAAGQLSNAVFNPITQSLLMSRHERLQLVLVVTATLLALVLHPIVIQRYGAIGSAIVTACILIGMNLMAYVIGFRRLKAEIEDDSHPSNPGS